MELDKIKNKALESAKILDNFIIEKIASQEKLYTNLHLKIKEKRDEILSEINEKTKMTYNQISFRNFYGICLKELELSIQKAKEITDDLDKI